MWIAQNTEFGPPEVVELSRASLPKVRKKEILIRSHATTVSAADWRLRSRQVPRGFGFIMGLIFGFRKPRYRCLGTEVAGEVIECGPQVSRFKVGDRVVANLGMKLGGHAQYISIPEEAPLAQIPRSVTFEDAAAMGAHVTGVCSTDKIPFVETLGADEVIDYRKDDWRKRSSLYDVILDSVGGTNFDNVESKLSEKGRLGLVVADLPLTLSSVWKSITHRKKAFAGPITETARDLTHLLELVEQGKFKPLIGEVLPLERIVEAHRRVEEGHKLGSLVIRLQDRTHQG
jgi:NADPH:quinone reductase-like Zn-dependent oxidoreductase